MVSVIIPAYNREDTIRKAAESVLNQTYKDLELIIVDDGSNDNTYSVMNDIAQSDSRVLCVKHDHNKGACAARNTGVRYAKGDLIAFQDSDDIWFDKKLEKQLYVFEKFDCDVCFCQFETARKGKVSVCPTTYSPGFQDKFDTVFTIGTVTLVVKKEVLVDNLFDETMPRLQDFEFMLRIVNKHSVYFLEMPLVRRVFSANSISKQNDSLIKACELLQKKYPDLKIQYPKACSQIARALIRNAFGTNGELRLQMISKALEYDCSFKTLLRIPYSFVVRNYD